MVVLTRPQCGQCVFWMADSSPLSGSCRRYPPAVFNGAIAGIGAQKFPTVDRRAWCGEWSDDRASFRDKAQRSMQAAAARKPQRPPPAITPAGEPAE